MVVDSMTYEEIGNELITDWYKHGKKMLDFKLKDNSIRRAAMKNGITQVPQFFKDIEISTKAGNDFVVVPYSNGKKMFVKQGLQIILFSMFYYNGRLMVGRLMNGCTFVALYEIHLFKRYCERYLKQECEITKNFVIKFFKKNLFIHDDTLNSSKRDEYDFARIRDGIMLGVIISPIIVLYKTFITASMAKGNQWDIMEKLTCRGEVRCHELTGRNIKYSSHEGNNMDGPKHPHVGLNKVAGIRTKQFGLK